MNWKSIIKIFCLLLLIPTGEHAFAQFYQGSQLNFGKNRVQHDANRFWTYFRYDDFDTYYYLGGRDYAIYTSRYAMSAIKEVEKRLDYKLEDKIQFIIFNNYSDLKESNIGLLSDEHYNIGGITYIVGTKVFVYFNGNYLDLEQQIRRGLSEVVLNEMLYGSQITSQMKNSTLIHLPDWYTLGLISWLSDDWSVEIDNIVRDGILSGKYKDFNGLTGNDAVYAGHSIWKYINDKYGLATISNIVYMTKVSRQVENGFLFVVGLSFESMTNEWLHFFSDDYYKNDLLRDSIQGSSIPAKQKKDMIFQRLTISPDGNRVAWVTNQSGKYKIMVYDRTTGKTKKIFRKGHKLDEKADLSYPLLAWHPSSKLLAFITEEKSYTKLYYYNFEEQNLIDEIIIDFQKITDFSFSPNGETFLLAAVVRGQSDIFIYNRSSRSYDHITKDIYDDINPSFIDNGKKIIFSSNRPNDTVRFDILTARIDTHRLIDKQQAFDIFLYNYKTRSEILWQVTKTPWYNEINPIGYQKNYIAYLSDENGIYNRFVARFDSTISFVDTITHYRYFSSSFPVTNYQRSILHHEINQNTGELSEIVLHDTKYHMNYQITPDAEELKPKELLNTVWRNQLNHLQSRKIEPETPDLDKKKVPVDEEKKKRRFVTVKKTDDPPPDSSSIDINDYDFGPIDDSTRTITEKAKKKQKRHDGFYIPNERVYHIEFSIDKLISQVDFNYINNSYQQFTGGGTPIFINPGINAFLKIGISDLLEDYRLTGGVRLSGLTNNEYFVSYENLKNRLDKQIIFHRKTIQTYDEYSYIKRLSHEGHYILKWPFSNVLAIRNSAIIRLNRDVFQSTDYFNLHKPDEYEVWASGRSELIFDNTRERGINTYFGTRFKIFGEYFQKADKLNENMIVVGADIRHYTQIHRTFIWANRFAASSSFGNNLLIYYMGGVDNWLFPKFDTDISIDQEKNWHYQTLATNMRGFHQNIRNGNSFFVINSELRFPAFRFFSNKPLKSSFLNNFQIIAFCDAGTAWTGPNPYSEENSLYSQIIEQGPIKMTVRRQVEPIVYGYGGGLRSTFLGYFIRADWAWGVEDSEIQDLVFYISLSLDF